ncbi:MAG: bifunctional aspartate kinase/diaminopimelate decarboxylase [Myxococcota bacterium]
MNDQISTRWVVLKFGGTSVATRQRWEAIAEAVQQRRQEGLRPVLVCSALAGVSNLLEELLDGAARWEHAPLLEKIRDVHLRLGDAMQLDTMAIVGEQLEELDRFALGASLVREVSPRLHARVMARGELMATRMGAAFLRSKGITADWVDIREHLEAVPEPGATLVRNMLSGSCPYNPDAAMQRAFAALAGDVIVTQGFIARGQDGATVLLGRGGSDTSASILAARLQAERCEIWTDVPGMFTANPRQIPAARLLRALDYDEAQEVVSTGAKVLHPRSIAPARAAGIPLHVLCTERPELEGTVVSSRGAGDRAQVKAISMKTGVMLISMDTPGMWQQVGFLSDVFACFKHHGLSIDMVSTSEMNVTVTLDIGSNPIDGAVLEAARKDLERHCRTRVIGPCASISLVGRHIRAILHKLGPALEVFEEQSIHLVSQAASDLNLSFVVDVDQAERLLRRLHALLFPQRKQDPVLGPSWQEMFEGDAEPVEARTTPWWEHRRAELIAMAEKKTPAYVLDAGSLDAAVDEIGKLDAVSRVLYAVKANPHPDVLRRFAARGLSFECVSPGEIDHVLSIVPDLATERILFTPNFAPRSEYREALSRGVRLTLDSTYPLHAWGDDLRNREVFLRIDPGRGRGHHEHVQTAGATSKFGIPLAEMDDAVQLVRDLGIRVVGLHAHLGSGIRTDQDWANTALLLARVAERFPDVAVLDLGGGLGVPERVGQVGLDLDRVAASLRDVNKAYPGYALWVEPGRFLVARAGGLLVRVTQTKRKGDVSYVGVDAGMNTLIRPALYGAYHEIVNLTRLNEPHKSVANVVGPICETGDTLGYNRSMPETREGDVLLIATVGAYGRAMSSRYNLREPADETMI